MAKAEQFFTGEEKKLILQSIKTAEKDTSGEIRVHLENRCPGDVLDRAAFLFEKLIHSLNIHSLCNSFHLPCYMLA